MKIIFLINGSQSSSAGIRAQTFSKFFPSHWKILFEYRGIPKWKSIGRFIFSSLKFRPDVVYVMDTAYAGVLAGYLVKILLRCKLVVDTGDVAFELAKSTGNYSTLQLKLISFIENLAIHHSNLLIVRGSYHKDFLKGQGIENVEFVPDGVVTSNIIKPESNVVKAELGLEKQVVVGMIGTMSWSERYQMCYGWDIVEALAFLKEKPIMGLLVGDGNGRKILEERAKELGVISKLKFIGQVSYSELPKYLATMDICISTQSNDLVGMVRTTGKLPLYLAYGKYVIATDVGEAKNVLPGIGSLLPYNGVKDENYPLRLAKELDWLIEKNQFSKTKDQACQVAIKTFDYKFLSERVSHALQRICV